MRAYLLGYYHGKNDGSNSTLIERGGCEKSYYETLDVEYVSVDTVLEIIDSCKDFHMGAHKMVLNMIAEQIKEFRG